MKRWHSGSAEAIRAVAAEAEALLALLVEPDAQGRIYLDDRLRRHAGLDVRSTVVVQGRLDRLEICSTERHERRMAAGEETFAEPTS